MKKSKTQKGITLIALIITIVVLLILAVVTINAIQEDGIIEYASNAADKYTAKASEEQENLNTLLGQIEGSLNDETEEDAPIIHSEIIPEGAKYYYNVTTCECDNIVFDSECTNCGGGTSEYDVLNAGEKFPDTINEGDCYIYGDYLYVYNYYYDEGPVAWEQNSDQNGWSVKYKGYNSNPEPILKTIGGLPITSLNDAFVNSGIEVAPVIPNTVENLTGTFEGCNNLVKAPIIPSSVQNMTETFYMCESLEGEVEINADPTEYICCFEETQKEITITGACSDTTKANLAGTATNGNVKY